MKKFAVLFLAMAFTATAFGATFGDVPRTHWAYDAIQKAVDAGILQGYDGKFHGQRLLNRYQMAVIVAKMLEKMGSGPAGTMDDGSLKKNMANLEALTIEFADELAKLNVQVSSLEDAIANLKGAGPAVHKPMSKEIGFTAFASFALVMEDEDAGAVRYSGTDSNYFTLPQVSLGVDKEVNPGVYFHAQFDYASDVNTALGGTVGINQAYFFVDEMFGDMGSKVGAFAPPFSMEHNGPFRTCNLTITPSIANTYHDSTRYYGLEVQKTKDVQPDDILWKFGIVSGTDFVGVPGATVGGALAGRNLMDDTQALINQGEVDDGFGFYIWIGKKPERSGDFGWNLSYFNNGGDANALAPATSFDTDFFQFGFEWANDDLLVMLQYLDGSSDFSGFAGPPNIDFTTFYLLLNYRLDDRQSLTLRYDDINWDFGGGIESDGDAITFAYNRKVTDNSIFQFEYLSFDSEDAYTVLGADADDDTIQFRYKVHF